MTLVDSSRQKNRMAELTSKNKSDWLQEHEWPQSSYITQMSQANMNGNLPKTPKMRYPHHHLYTLVPCASGRGLRAPGLGWRLVSGPALMTFPTPSSTGKHQQVESHENPVRVIPVADGRWRGPRHVQRTMSTDAAITGTQSSLLL